MRLPSLILMLAIAWPAAACGAEPEIAFTVNDGWVELKVTQDGKSVPDVGVRVFDSRGGKFADGSTGEEGSGEFPMPPGTQLRVEVRIGDRTADMILLTQLDGIVVPTSVLLSFGLAPCCRFPARSAIAAEVESPPAPEPGYSFGDIPRWMQAALGAVLTLLGIGTLVRHERRASRTSRAHE